MTIRAKKGRWEAPGQVPIIVTDDGYQANGFYAPWVKYHFPWETEDQAKAVLWTAFSALVEQVGYRFVE